MDKKILFIVTYHFNSKDILAYDRLIRCLRSIILQIKKEDKILLIANGLEQGAEDPDNVIKSVGLGSSYFLPYKIENNKGNVGALNEGMEIAIKCFGVFKFIANIQSSVVINSNWVKLILGNFENEKIELCSGRLVIEGNEDFIWADGHYLEGGKTKNSNFRKFISKETNTDVPIKSKCFPCLSAVMIKRSLCEDIIKKYGNFISPTLPHYGDCTDLALRAYEIKQDVSIFLINKEAVAVKRLPILDEYKVSVSQILAAYWYYNDKVKDILEDWEKKYGVNIRNDFDKRKLRYSMATQPPKAPKSMDEKWVE